MNNLLPLKVESFSTLGRVLLILCFVLVANSSFAATKTIDCFAGTDTLNISYNSYDMGDFSTSYNSTSNTITFTDPSSNTIAASNCEYFNFNSVTYRFIYNGYDYVSQQQVNNGTSCDIGDGENNRISHAFISNDGTKVYLFTPSDSDCTNYTIPSATAFDTPDSMSDISKVTITGSGIADMISDRGGMGSLPIIDVNAGAGNDQVSVRGNSSKEDTVNLEAGDDIVYVGSDYQTDNFDGGVGSDWFAFSFGGPSAITMTINTHDSSNFENIAGSTGNDVFTGDGSANILLGGKGNDTLTGGAGDDTLYGGIGQNCSGTNLVNDKNFTVGIYYNHYYQGAGNDTLYGQAGNDTLYGQCQDDTLDGGTGADILHGGDGTDTFVIRSGDGGEAITDADTIQDFTDGTDVLGLASLNYSDLTIEQGTGSYSSHVVVKKTSSGEFLAVVQNISVSDVTIIDFTSTSTSSQTISGTSGNDQSIGGSGNDTFNGGAGSDTLYGWGGNDTFNITNKSGTYTDTLNGGSGNDTLNVSYSSYDVTNFDIAYNSSTNTITFTDPNGGVINASNFEYFNFNSVTYRFIYNGYDYVSQQQVNNGTSCDIGDGENNRISHAFISNDGTKVYLFTPSDSDCTNYTIPSATAFDTPDSMSDISKVTITGSGIADMISDRGGMGSLPIIDVNAGAGNDQVSVRGNSSKEDTVNLEAGDDIVYVGSDYQTDNFDGGVGSDWFAFSFGGPSAITMTINTHDSSNFENIAGSTGNDVFTGDGSANILLGGKGNDTLTGGAGDDTLYGGIGQNCSGTNLVNDKNFTVGIYYNHYYQGAGNDTLYGQAGNDTLYGQCQDDTLDGGTGADILHGGDGTDTFVIRSGDGGEAITDADTIQDFTDGTDVLGLASLNYSDLTIEQGTGSYSSHVVVKKTSSGEFLAVVQNISVSDVTIIDFTSTSTSSQTISGTSGNDQSIGGSGNDTFNGGAGSDTLYGWGGNDTFNITNKSGTYTDTLNGGSGNDTLNVSYSSYDVTNFDIAYNSSTNTITFTDPNGGVINASNFEYFNFNSVTYRFIYNGYDYVSQQQVNNGTSCDIGDGENNRISHAFISNDGTKVYLFTPSDSDCTNYTIPSATAFDTPDSMSDISKVTITGSGIADMISDRGGMGSLPIIDVNAGAGNDQVSVRGNSSKEDTVNLEAGDDIVYVGSDYQTDNFDGGVGSDWFAFSFGGPSAITMTINTHDSSNFENIAGSTGNDVFTGDGSANILLGGKGNDTLTGGAGDDTLYGGIGQNCSGTNLVNDKNFTVGIYYNHYYQGAGNDTLYGQAGNDTLYGQCQDDTLDGGTGADILHGGDGTDTFVIRSGDGGEAITDADTVTDFTDETDIIGMSGLNYSDLTIEQGTGSYSSHVVVKKTSSGEFLTIIQNISLSSVDDNDFSAI